MKYILNPKFREELYNFLGIAEVDFMFDKNINIYPIDTSIFVKNSFSTSKRVCFNFKAPKALYNEVLVQFEENPGDLEGHIMQIPLHCILPASYSPYLSYMYPELYSPILDSKVFDFYKDISKVDEQELISQFRSMYLISNLNSFPLLMNILTKEDLIHLNIIAMHCPLSFDPYLLLYLLYLNPSKRLIIDNKFIEDLKDRLDLDVPTLRAFIYRISKSNMKEAQLRANDLYYYLQDKVFPKLFKKAPKLSTYPILHNSCINVFAERAKNIESSLTKLNEENRKKEINRNKYKKGGYMYETTTGHTTFTINPPPQEKDAELEAIFEDELILGKEPENPQVPEEMEAVEAPIEDEEIIF